MLIYSNMHYKRAGSEAIAHVLAERVIDAGCFAVACPRFEQHHGVHEHHGWRVYYGPSKLPAWVFDVSQAPPKIKKLLQVMGGYHGYISLQKIRGEVGLSDEDFRHNLDLATRLCLVEHPGGSQKSLQLTRAGRLRFEDMTID